MFNPLFVPVPFTPGNEGTVQLWNAMQYALCTVNSLRFEVFKPRMVLFTHLHVPDRIAQSFRICHSYWRYFNSVQRENVTVDVD